MDNWRVLMVAVVMVMGSGLFVGVTTASPGHGYGSYNDYDHHGLSYNVIPAQPVVKQVYDYHAKPKYSFGYEVEDYYNQLSHGRWEVRDGDVTQGQYRVLLPDGRIQIVSYVADKGGYRPHIQYINKGVHPPAPPAYAHVKIPEALIEPVVAAPIVHQIPLQVAPVQQVVPYGPEQGHHYGGGYGYHQGYDGLLSASRISKKRALLYDRTLFRRDIPKPATKPRK